MPVGGAGAGAQLVDLALQPRGLQRALGDQDQPIGLERLLDEVVGAELDRRHRGLDVAVAGNHHHRHVAVLLLDDLQQLAGRRAASPAARCRAAPDAAGAPRSPPAPRRNCAPGAVEWPSSERMPETIRECRLRRRRPGYRRASGRPVCLRSAADAGGGPAPAAAASKRNGSVISTCAPRPPSARGEAVEQFDPAVMVLEDLDDDRQAEAGAFGARRDVGLDQLAPILARKALAVVADGDADDAVVDRRARRRSCPSPRARRARRCPRRRS